MKIYDSTNHMEKEVEVGEIWLVDSDEPGHQIRLATADEIIESAAAPCGHIIIEKDQRVYAGF